MLGEGRVRPREGQDRLVGAADRTLRYPPRLHVGPLQEMRYLVHPRDHEPLLRIGGFVRDLGVGGNVLEAPCAQDLHRPVEVDISDLSAPDLLVRRRVEPRTPGWCTLPLHCREPFPLACLRHMIANEGVNKSIRKSIVRKRACLQAKSKSLYLSSLQALTLATPLGDSGFAKAHLVRRPLKRRGNLSGRPLMNGSYRIATDGRYRTHTNL